MANIQCDACENLRENAPNLIVNGFTDTECANLKVGKGLGGSGDNCEDVSDMNDCFVGMMDNEVDAYDNCDWKKFMHNFIPNVWSVLKAIICWLCGLDCRVNTLYEGIKLKISEDDSGQSYIVAGKGVSFLQEGTEQRDSQVTFEYIGGALVQVIGTLTFHKEDFNDVRECYNFDDGSVMHKRKNRQGNSLWDKTSGDVRVMEGGGELLYEIRISRKQYPQIKRIYSGIAAPSGGGAYQVNLTVFGEGDWAYGQHGNCDSDTGVGSGGHSNGHKVPEGWLYVQARMVNISYLSANGTGKYSPKGFMGIQLYDNRIKC